MDNKNETLKLYEIYTLTKENFIDRSFATNKFYLILCLILLTTCIFLPPQFAEGYQLTVLAIFGFCIAVLWWFNQDSYDFLIKVKYRNVIQTIEKDLAFDPVSKEHLAIQERLKARKAFIFGAAQKLLALLNLIAFFVIILCSLLPYFQWANIS